MKHLKLYENWISEEDSTEAQSSEMVAPSGYIGSSIKILLNNKTDLKAYYNGEKNDYEYYKNHKFIFKVLSGDLYEKSPGGTSPIRNYNSIDKIFFMKEGGTADIDITEDKKSRGDGYTLKCNGGKITISSLSAVGP